LSWRSAFSKTAALLLFQAQGKTIAHRQLHARLWATAAAIGAIAVASDGCGSGGWRRRSGGNASFSSRRFSDGPMAACGGSMTCIGGALMVCIGGSCAYNGGAYNVGGMPQC
jgi:hypothetical protein